MEDVPIDKRQPADASLINHCLIALCCPLGRMSDNGFIDGVDPWTRGSDT
jgi:hypothetical protein